MKFVQINDIGSALLDGRAIKLDPSDMVVYNVRLYLTMATYDSLHRARYGQEPAPGVMLLNEEQGIVRKFKEASGFNAQLVTPGWTPAGLLVVTAHPASLLRDMGMKSRLIPKMGIVMDLDMKGWVWDSEREFTSEEALSQYRAYNMGSAIRAGRFDWGYYGSAFVKGKLALDGLAPAAKFVQWRKRILKTAGL